MGESIELAVCGLHMSGGTLNHQMVSAGATLLRRAHTTAEYTLHAVSDASTGEGCKPALVRHPGGTATSGRIALEVWDVPVGGVGALFCGTVGALAASGKTTPLAFGVVVLHGGAQVAGFVGEGWAADGEACESVGVRSEDITRYGGWREWRSAHGLPA